MLRLSLAEDQANHQIVLEKAYQNNLETFNLFMSKGLYRSFTQQAIFADYYLINRLGRIDTPGKISEVFKIQYDLFCHLNVICQSVFVHLENALESLNKISTSTIIELECFWQLPNYVGFANSP